MPILNYTTQVDSYKTISEIHSILSKHGANKIVIDNNEHGYPASLTFVIKIEEKNIAFALPCNFQGVLKAMKNDKKVSKTKCTEEQALKVGWRIIKHWIEAQMAIIESQLVDIAEVFLPYAITNTGETLYEYLKTNNNQLLLTEKK